MNWFAVQDSKSECLLTFQTAKNDKWLLDVLSEYPLPQSFFAGKRLRIDGRAPLWMYVHVAIHAVRDGVKEIYACQPQLPDAVKVFPLEQVRSNSSAWMERNDPESGGTVLQFLPPSPGDQWSLDLLPHLASSSTTWSHDLITLTGPTANWLYAASAALAATVPDRLIIYSSPGEDNSVLWPNSNSGPQHVLQNPYVTAHGSSPGKVIGVIGDPNSGKSIFSILLTHGFHTAGLKPAWRLDCDHAARTPHWYLQMLQEGLDYRAKELRDGQKRPWTADAEQRLARDIGNCSRNLAWTIADFPGGIHKAERVQRIPEGRQVLLQPADCFIILRRGDRADAEVGWRKELAKHGLGDRIVAVVESALPDKSLAVKVNAVDEIRAFATGLDRGHLASEHIKPSLPDWARLASLIVDRITCRNDSRKYTS